LRQRKATPAQASVKGKSTKIQKVQAQDLVDLAGLADLVDLVDLVGLVDLVDLVGLEGLVVLDLHLHLLVGKINPLEVEAGRHLQLKGEVVGVSQDLQVVG